MTDWEYRGISPMGMAAMMDTARAVVRAVQNGTDATPDDIVAMATMIRELCTEIDALNWRATVAAMALDGRVSPGEVRLNGNA